MTDQLPPNLLALFAPRPPLRWVPPCDYAPEARKTTEISGIAAFLPALQQYKKHESPEPTESWLDKRDRKKLVHFQQVEATLQDVPNRYKPQEDPNIRGDPFKTLIVARLSYEADESDLEREFSRFGRIERIRIVKNTKQDPRKKSKPHRGYAFIVFEREKDFQIALKASDGLRIKDRRIKVDFERGRTVVGWRPRRFGGGLGGRGYSRAMPSRPTASTGYSGGGGFRGSQRGEFRGRFGGRGGGFGQRGNDHQNGSGPPSYAPSGPSAGRSGEDHDGDRPHGGGHDDRHGGNFRDGNRFNDRDRFRERDRRVTGSNMEPIRPREPRDRDEGRDSRDSRDRSFRDQDYRSGRDQRDSRGTSAYRGDKDRPRDDNRKRGYDGQGFDEPESRRPRRY